MEAKPTELFDSFAESVTSQEGKVIVITGCTSGTGNVLANLAASKGATVLMLNRASSRADAAYDALNAKFEGKAVKVVCDLQDYASVREAAEKIKADYPEGIDVLCNNAGIMAFPDIATKDGYDIQMQTNHLSHFLLTKELMPLLEKKAEAAGEARVVNHSSIARLFGPALIADYMEKKGGDLGGSEGNDDAKFSGPNWLRYQQTKLANLVFTYALADKLEAKGSKVKAFCAHPGVSMTKLFMTTMAATGSETPPEMEHMLDHFQSGEDGTLGIAKSTFLPDAASGTFFGPAGIPDDMTAWKGDAVPLGADFTEEEKKMYTKESKDLLWTKSEEAVGEFAL